MSGLFDKIEKQNKKELDEYEHKALFLEIVATLKKVYPKVSESMDYHGTPIKKFIDHYVFLGTRKDNYDILCNNFTESCQVGNLNQMCKDLKYELITPPREGKGSRENYWKEMTCPPDTEGLDLDKVSEFEKGVLACIGYMRFRVHCICDN